MVYTAPRQVGNEGRKMREIVKRKLREENSKFLKKPRERSSEDTWEEKPYGGKNRARGERS